LRLFPSSLPSRLKQNKLVWLGNVEDAGRFSSLT
jgi:hypothetical protein